MGVPAVWIAWRVPSWSVTWAPGFLGGRGPASTNLSLRPLGRLLCLPYFQFPQDDLSIQQGFSPRPPPGCALCQSSVLLLCVQARVHICVKGQEGRRSTCFHSISASLHHWSHVGDGALEPPFMAEHPILALCRENNGTVGTAVPTSWSLQPGEQEKACSFCMTCVFSPEPRKRSGGGGQEVEEE